MRKRRVYHVKEINYNNFDRSCFYVKYAYCLSVPLENIVYVSPNGNAENADGTIDDPFSTVEAARDYLRTKDIGKDSRGIIYLREGTYHVTNSISLTSEDSYVTYAAYKGESVEITGSATLDNGKFKKLSEVSGEKYSSQDCRPEWLIRYMYMTLAQRGYQ